MTEEASCSEDDYERADVVEGGRTELVTNSDAGRRGYARNIRMLHCEAK